MVKRDKGRKMPTAGDYSSVLEEYNRDQGYLENHPAEAPADISQAFKRSEYEIGKSKVPRLKEYRVKGK